MTSSLAATPALPGRRRILDLPAQRGQLRLRAVRDGLVISGLLAAAFVLVVIPLVGRSLGYDTVAYWSVDLKALYDRSVGNLYALGGFRYAPPIALVLAPFGALPWSLFLLGWLALTVAAVLYLGGRWWLIALAFPPVALEIEQGNVHLLLAAAIVMGFRWPWTWSFVLLTKVTPGIGLLWFAVRREWRKLAIALGFTALVALGSWLLAPGLWTEWLNTLLVNTAQPQDYSIPPPLFVRLPMAVVLVIWGARTDRPWTVGIAATLALPLLWPHGFAVALAALPYLRRRAEQRRAADPEGARRRFIPLGQLFGRDPDGARWGGPSPWLAVGAGVACVAGAVLIATFVPGVQRLLAELSSSIVN